MDLALNNIQRLICHKKKTNKPTNQAGYNGFEPIEAHLVSFLAASIKF